MPTDAVKKGIAGVVRRQGRPGGHSCSVEDSTR